MTSSAGMAFSPHVITIGVQEVIIFFYFIGHIDFDPLTLLIYCLKKFWMQRVKAACI